MKYSKLRRKWLREKKQEQLPNNNFRTILKVWRIAELPNGKTVMLPPETVLRKPSYEEVAELGKGL